MAGGSALSMGVGLAGHAGSRPAIRFIARRSQDQQSGNAVESRISHVMGTACSLDEDADNQHRRRVAG